MQINVRTTSTIGAVVYVHLDYLKCYTYMISKAIQICISNYEKATMRIVWIFFYQKFRQIQAKSRKFCCRYFIDHLLEHPSGAQSELFVLVVKMEWIQFLIRFGFGGSMANWTVSLVDWSPVILAMDMTAWFPSYCCAGHSSRILMPLHLSTKLELMRNLWFPVTTCAYCVIDVTNNRVSVLTQGYNLGGSCIMQTITYFEKSHFQLMQVFNASCYSSLIKSVQSFNLNATQVQLRPFLSLSYNIRITAMW